MKFNWRKWAKWPLLVAILAGAAASIRDNWFRLKCYFGSHEWEPVGLGARKKCKFCGKDTGIPPIQKTDCDGNPIS